MRIICESVLALKQMKTNSDRRFFVMFFVISLVSFFSLSCRLASSINAEYVKNENLGQIEKRPYLVLIEGFKPISGKRMMFLGQRLSHMRNVSVCYTSSNHNVHMLDIIEAYKNKQPIYIAGFSAGEVAAINLTKDCERYSIPVEKLFLLDGVKKKKIPANVKKVIDIVGTVPYFFRRSGRYSDSDLDNENTHLKFYDFRCSHLNLPYYSDYVFLKEIPF
jgi:hypothetical protein